MPKLLKLIEVCKYLEIPRRTFYLMIEDGRFNVKPMKGFKPRRWNKEDIDEWLRNGK